MVKTRDIHVPSFRYSEVNKRTNGTIRSHNEVIASNINSIIDTMESEDAAFICCREKIENSDDYRYAIFAIPSEGNDVEIAQLSYFNKMPTIILNGKSDILNTIKRVLNNLIFS
jgi:hypothetical protein